MTSGSQTFRVSDADNKKSDPDVLLPLKLALDMIYQRGLYNLSIDYSQVPPPPDFSEEEKKWISEVVKP